MVSAPASRFQGTTAYANLEICATESADLGTAVAVSHDSGNTWSRLQNPAGSKHFNVRTDSHLPGLLIGSAAASVQRGDIWASSDQGTTRITAPCPGVLQGICRIFVLDNIFGAGARLPVTDRLPLAVAAITAVAAGGQAGDPVFIVGKQNGVVHIFRSRDAGQTWQVLPPWQAPNAITPRSAPGALLVRRTLHSVAAPFVPTYHRMSPLVLGYPVTEAFRSESALTQDFQHLELQVDRGRTVVAPLGHEVLAYQLDTSGGLIDNTGSAAPVASRQTYDLPYSRPDS